jgi:hypothetical protein
VLVVSNDPDEDPDLTKFAVSDNAALAYLSIPIKAVANTRTSRGRLAVDQLEAAMDGIAPSKCDGTAHVRVWPQFATASGEVKKHFPSCIDELVAISSDPNPASSANRGHQKPE